MIEVAPLGWHSTQGKIEKYNEEYHALFADECDNDALCNPRAQTLMLASSPTSWPGFGIIPVPAQEGKTPEYMIRLLGHQQGRYVVHSITQNEGLKRVVSVARIMPLETTVHRAKQQRLQWKEPEKFSINIQTMVNLTARF